ncbi:dihydrofolate reductase family protein [Marinicellulosiphila megalodicopiae]|uniref:dihydrofolate reductase family protein n=1 Tax=Marinicellulosiphila megalodicopiae TaxID=2724896 RepID=UPI003BB09E7B
MTNIVYIATSLDGYIADKNNQVDWLHDIQNKDGSDMGYADLMDRIDVIVMGKNTFDLVASFDGDWPYTKPVVVLSQSMKTIPNGCEDKIQIMSGNPQQIMQQIKTLGFKNAYIDGGNTIQQFLQANLIDELIITTIPVLLGGGISLFGSLEQPIKCEIQYSNVFSNEIVQSGYLINKKQI